MRIFLAKRNHKPVIFLIFGNRIKIPNIFNMRKHILAGNWKMNKTFSEGTELIRQIIEKESIIENVQLIIAPPFILTKEAFNLTSNTKIAVSGQNCSNQAKGAFTGEISAEMLKSVGAKYVILGHSERRAYYHETNALINEKIKISLQNGFTNVTVPSIATVTSVIGDPS
ncbi:MAG: hypothetical protein C0597_01770, partial [Marinilabiliales bacterium]